jgi:hypothetical protein
MTLCLVSGDKLVRHVECLPGEAVEHPNQPQGPANCGVAAQAAPAEQEVQTDFLARDYGSEDDKDRGACIVGELQEDDLGEDAGGGEVRKGAGSRRAASAWHQYANEVL